MPIARITGPWTGMLRQWLRQQSLADSGALKQLERWQHQESVPIQQWKTTLQRALQHSRSEAPELQVGQQVTLRHLGLLGYLALVSDTLGDAMLAYQRYETLLYGAQLAQILVRDDHVELRWPDTETHIGQQGDGVSLAALFTFLRSQLPLEGLALGVGFIHSSPHEQAYRDFFRCPVHFHQPCVWVRIAPEALRMRMPRANREQFAQLNQEAEATQRRLRDQDALLAALHQALPGLLAEGRGDLHAIAHRLHTSGRTLQRKLQARNTSWQAQLDLVRQQWASVYLQDPALSLPEVALLLGYSEQSAFTRAYRRWTGSTPGTQRRRACGRG